MKRKFARISRGKRIQENSQRLGNEVFENQIRRLPNLDLIRSPREKVGTAVYQRHGGFKVERFNQFLESLPGISPKVLSIRLKELEREGFIKKTVEKKDPPMIVRWSLTEKGIDTIPIEMMLTAFGSKWNADRVFDDKKPRKLHELFDEDAMNLIQKFL